MSVRLNEKAIISPLISVTSPRETNVETIFFPPRRKVDMKTSGALSGEQTEIRILKDTSSRTVNTNSTFVLPRLKPNMIGKPDPGHFYMDHFTSNKENLLDYDHRQRHVITTRKGLARADTTTREREHVLPISVNMSGSKTQVKKVKIAAGSLRRQGQVGKTSLTTTDITRDKKTGVTTGNDKDTNISLAALRVHDSRSPRTSPREELSRHSVNGKGIGKPAASSQTEEKKSKPGSLPQGNHTLLQLKDSAGRDERVRRVSPGSSLELIAEESFTKDARRSSATKPKGLGIERKAKTPSKVASNSSSAAARHRRNDETRDQRLEDRVQQLELPEITMNEVLQSWNIGPARTRSSSLAGKDPMEFLRSRERSNSDPKQRTTTIEELKRCRYLRTGGKEDHGKVCSCNSCEHGEGLKSTPYLNS